MFCVLIRLRPEQTVQVSNFCDEKARADLADYRLAAAMSHCLPPTRKISDGANSIARQTDFSIVLRNSEDNTCTGWLMDIAYSCARTWRLQGSSHPCSRNLPTAGCDPRHRTALANKLARMAWAVLAKNEKYRPPMLAGAAPA